MTSRIQILAIVGSVAFLLLVLELVRRRRLAEEYSALWIVAALVLLAHEALFWKDWLHARREGREPPVSARRWLVARAASALLAAHVLSAGANIARARAEDATGIWLDQPMLVDPREFPLVAANSELLAELRDDDLFLAGVEVIIDSAERTVARSPGEAQPEGVER